MRLNVVLRYMGLMLLLNAVVGVYFVVQQFRYGFLSVAAEFSADICVGCFPADFRTERRADQYQGGLWDRGGIVVGSLHGRNDALYALGR